MDQLAQGTVVLLPPVR